MNLDIPAAYPIPSIDIDAYVAMEKVYTAVDGHREVFRGAVDGYDVAIKIASEPAIIEQLKEEAETLRILDGSTRSPRLYLDAYSETNNKQVLAMEYLEGPSLGDVLGVGPDWVVMNQPDSARAHEIIGHIAAAEQDVLDRGVLYRDYNLKHFIFTAPDHVSFIDFGLSLAYPYTGDDDHMVWATNTLPDGTWEFMAPEEFVGGAELDESVVTYRLGILYHLLVTGDMPVPQFENLADARAWAINPQFELSDKLSDYQKSFVENCVNRSSPDQGVRTVEQFLAGVDWLADKARGTAVADISRAALKHVD
jgi:serine/threonine protein kinase